MLVKMRAQRTRLTPLGRVLHVMARSQLVCHLMMVFKPNTDPIRWSTALYHPLLHHLELAGGCKWEPEMVYPVRLQD